jgi:hypothetical protein
MLGPNLGQLLQRLGESAIFDRKKDTRPQIVTIEGQTGNIAKTGARPPMPLTEKGKAALNAIRRLNRALVPPKPDSENKDSKGSKAKKSEENFLPLLKALYKTTAEKIPAIKKRSAREVINPQTEEEKRAGKRTGKLKALHTRNHLDGIFQIPLAGYYGKLMYWERNVC